MHSPEPSTHWLADGVAIVDDFASAAECGELLDELEVTFWRPSLTYQRQADGRYEHVLADARVSETAHQDWFGEELEELLGTLDARLEASFGAGAPFLEWWQATRYPIGGKFDYHLDAGYWDDHPAGERIRTFLVFLDTPAAGGGTHFRALDVLVEARAGRLLMWENLFPDGSPDHRMIHSGTPLREGSKTTLVTWQRQMRFRPAATEATKEAV